MRQLSIGPGSILSLARTTKRLPAEKPLARRNSGSQVQQVL
jgi:hypothetical protein